jgi:SH3 domain
MMSRSSTAKLLLNLQRLVIQAIATRKQGTIVSALTNADMGEDHLWASIGRDLQVAGISREMVTANRDVIRQQIECLFGSGLIASDNIFEDAESSWEGGSISRAASTVTFGRAASTSPTMHQKFVQNNAFYQQDQNNSYLGESRRLPTALSQPSRLRSRQTGRQRNELPQCPWPKLSGDQSPLTNDDATYRPYVVEIKLVTPPSKSTTHEIDGFSFKRNHVSEHSWVFLRLSQHTRDGIRSLSTPDPYNPIQDHGRQFSQKWTEFAFSQAFRDWRHMLLRPDQPVYICLPSSQENVLDALAKDPSLAFPIAFSFDLDTDAIVFWKLARRWPGSSALQYRAKSMDEVPRRGLLQYIKRISLRKQAKTLNLDGVQGQGQMLMMLFTQKAIDQSRAWANTWIMEQEFSGGDFRASSGPYSSYSDTLKSSSTFVGSNNSDAPTGSVSYGSLPSTNLQTESLSYLAKASAVCAFEASLPHELNFTSGDEIWITHYAESDVWEGINQRTQQKGLFPNTLVKVFLVKRMPSREKMPFEIGTSAHSFEGMLPSPIARTGPPAQVTFHP